jgi:hypothetical protein
LLHEYVSSNKTTNTTNNQIDDTRESEYNSIRRRVITKMPRSSENDYDKNDDDDDDDDQNIDEILNENDDLRRIKKDKTERFWFVCKRAMKILCITKGKRYGNYLLALFVFVKVLYTVNSVMQLFILNHFLGNDYLLLGVEVISKVWNGDDWTQVKRFPRVVRIFL